MVQGYYSLEEAAEFLGMPVDELKRMAQKRDIRAFADKGSWKFRQQDIEELRRTRQLGSDPEIRLSDLAEGGKDEHILDSDEHVVFDDSAFTNPSHPASDSAATVIGVRGGQNPDSDVRLVVTGEGATGDSDVRLVPEAGPAGPGDSGEEIPLAGDIAKSPSDSDIRLTFDDSSAGRPRSIRDTEHTDEIDLDAELAARGMKTPTPTKRQPPEKTESDLDFKLDDDLTTGFKLEGQDVPFNVDEFDSDSNDAIPTPKSRPGSFSKDETIAIDDMRLDDGDIDLGGISDATVGMSSSDSGINLTDADDSGISLEAESGQEQTSDSEFELSLDSSEDSDFFASEDMPAFKEADSAPKIAAGKGAPAPKAKAPAKAKEDSSDSEDFDLDIDDEIEIEESASDVVAIDEEDDSEDDSEDDFAEDDFDDQLTPVGKGPKARPATGVVASAVSAPWPGWLLCFLVPTLIFLGLTGMMMHEVMRHAYSTNTAGTLNATVIEQVYGLAKMVGL